MLYLQGQEPAAKKAKQDEEEAPAVEYKTVPCKKYWTIGRCELGPKCVYIRVVRGDINFEILRDPLDFLFLIDPYGPYLIEFSFENGSFLLTKALFWVNFCPFRATGRKGRG